MGLLITPAGYPPNRQPATVGAEERGGRGTTSSRTTTGAAPELSPPKSACADYAVLRTSTRGTVPMGQCAGCHRGQHLTVHISTSHALSPPASGSHCPAREDSAPHCGIEFLSLSLALMDDPFPLIHWYIGVAFYTMRYQPRSPHSRGAPCLPPEKFERLFLVC